MIKQIVFIALTVIAFGLLIWSFKKIFAFFKFTKAFPIRDIGKRIAITLDVAIFQTKIFRRPIIGLLHALVFWGFCVILFGSLEMMIDGAAGIEKSLSFLGPVYTIISASGDVFALIVLVAVLIFLIRRVFMHIKRFTGIEMQHKSHVDANIALTLILLLMVSLLGMNVFYITSVGPNHEGYFPVSSFIAGFIGTGEEDYFLYEFCWWMHISLIYVFMNVLPYSKHFHVFMSVPNVFLSRLAPLGKLPNMDSITKEVKMMMDPNLAFATPTEPVAEIERFGVKDIEDVTWKNYLDSLSCTECGRCTASCPANITGKKLSPRKLMIDMRARMKEKGPEMLKNGKTFTDNKSLLNDYISAEELWACTTCNACAQECPVNINHPELIVAMRRYLVMEEAAAPSGLNIMFSNIENNGAPWQFSPEDRLLWTNDLTIKQ